MATMSEDSRSFGPLQGFPYPPNCKWSPIVLIRPQPPDSLPSTDIYVKAMLQGIQIKVNTNFHIRQDLLILSLVKEVDFRSLCKVGHLWCANGGQHGPVLLLPLLPLTSNEPLPRIAPRLSSPGCSKVKHQSQLSKGSFSGSKQRCWKPETSKGYTTQLSSVLVTPRKKDPDATLSTSKVLWESRPETFQRAVCNPWHLKQVTQ